MSFFIRYSLVGSVATSGHYLALIFLVEILHFLPALASSIGALFGALLAYVGNSNFTFKKPKQHQAALPKFLFVAGFGAMLNGTIVGLGAEFFEFHYLILQLIATLVVLSITFQFNRFWSFQE